jgi:3-methyladenine DNA glycosylase/8-oxoguanine DNA glycosylase
VLGRHARTIHRAATTIARLDPTAHDPDALSARLEAIPGIGRWTAQVTLATVIGHPDAVPTGDFHLPHTIAWALAGEERGDDDRMLELLEPFRGHRWRVICLLREAGIKAPRRGPKRGAQTHRRLGLRRG